MYHRPAADRIGRNATRFEDDDPVASTGELSGGHRPGDSGADNDDIIFGVFKDWSHDCLPRIE
jgi:hypothetical protein